ncbi:MAG TPA: GAF and ANTAR domain-containing protein [Streptosporangiaceae bacterium]|jgi:ANTAR domain|nr:GAF and ANTAR domain-containing protein [Streptosporangiaceae bacterium]
MPDGRHTVLWGLVVARAARHGRPATAGDVCEIAVASGRVSGGWVAAAGGPGPDFLMHVTDPVSEWLAEFQLTLGEGPCHDVQISEGLALGSDLGDAQSRRRWPVFAPAAMQRGARAVFAFPLTIGSIRVGVMGLYRDSAGPLPAAQLRDCLLLADTATVLLIEAGSHGVEDAAGGDGDGAGLPGQSADLALHRAEIDQATGMLTVQLGATAAEAFARLRAYAYAQDRRLADVARDIVTRRLRLSPDSPADGDH